ncbi:AAC(3) family N-acetyltransferase [Sutcliffiella horikoshii]|uniref:AAC(3) family N-acetyltransferase n=1 Tax=Sutcliffiella horikoshii TaxID=79883 RepID=UPI0038508BB4
MVKKNLRLIVRKMISAGENETINNAINRKKIKFKKKIFKKAITLDELQLTLLNLGINKGDNIMVHASWREFFNYQGKPEDVINTLKDLIGEDGTLLMPSYGNDRTFFDVNNTTSNAGVLSELFRLQMNTIRSACTHFSISASGKNAFDLTKNHFKSEYGFDNNSPYYLFTKLPNSKVLFLGLGQEPTQISLFHCAGYILKDKIPIYSKLLSYRYNSILVKDGVKFEKDMVIRQPGHKNNNQMFKRIFRSVNNKKQVKISNLDIVIMDAKEGLDKAIEFGKKGKYCYINMEKLK